MARPKIKVVGAKRKRLLELIKRGIGRREAFPVIGVSRVTMYKWQAKAESDNKAGIVSDETKLFDAVEKAEGELMDEAMKKVTIGKDVTAFEFMAYMQKRLDRKEAKEDAARERESGGMDGYKPPPTE